MKIKEMSEKRLAEHLSKDHHKDEWRVLILDEIVHRNLSSLMDLHSLLSYDILTIQKFNDKRAKVEYPAVYICFFNEETKSIIKQDIKSQKYTGYKIFAINREGEFSVTIRDGIKVSKKIFKYEKIDICFRLDGEVVKVDPENINDLCSVLRVNSHVHYALGDQAQESNSNFGEADKMLGGRMLR